MATYEELMVMAVKKARITDRFIISSPSKINLKPHCAFSLPAGPKFSCPGVTEACKDCYATKYRHLWPPVQEAFAKNWRLIKGLEKNKDSFSAKAMLSGSIPENIGRFRIHESGDFYSSWYINVWSGVIKSRKDVNFWAYTRSFGFDYKAILRNKNFMLWASTDDYNLEEAREFVSKYNKYGVRHAYGPFDKTKDVPQDLFVCPVTSKKMAINGACEKCGFCITRDSAKKDIIFLLH